MPSSIRIAIVGGGIGGLTAALALRARGLEVAVFEQAEALREIGAGVSIHPNAARLLRRIGLEDQLQRIGSPISGIALRTSHGEPITTPAGPATPAFSKDDQGYNVHRASFLNLIFDALPKGTVTLGHRCIQLSEEADRIHLSFANGASTEADVVIGADGIRSVVQREIGLQSRPTSEGIMAYRGLIPAERLPWASNLKDPALWLGSGRSFLLYPVARGRLINMVAFVPTDTDSDESWSAPGDLKALAAEYAGWDQPVQDTINSLEETFLGASTIALRFRTGRPSASRSWAMQRIPWFHTSGKGPVNRSRTALRLPFFWRDVPATRSPTISSSTRRSGSSAPARSRRSRVRPASYIGPSTTTLRRRPRACANGWRRGCGSSRTMRKEQPWTRWRSSVAEDEAAARAPLRSRRDARQ